MSVNLFQRERGSEIVDRALADKGVPALQRAVVLLLLGHPRVVKSDALRGLKITLRAAAEWMLDNVECVRGLSCEHTGVNKALQCWIDRGVVVLQGTMQNRVLWLETNRLRDWHDSQPDFDEPPLFAPIAIGTPDPSLLTRVDSLLPSVDRCCPLLTAVDSQERREEEDEENSSSIGRKITHPPHPLLTPNQRESTAVNSGQQGTSIAATQALVAQLPLLPDEVWDKDRPDASLHRTIGAWWAEHGLADVLGDQSDAVANMLCGLLLRSKSARSPRDFFAYCVNGTVKPVVIDEGRAWRRRNAPKGGSIVVAEDAPPPEQIKANAAAWREKMAQRQRRASGFVLMENASGEPALAIV